MTEADKALDQIALIIHKSKKPDVHSWEKIGEILKLYYAEQKRAAARDEAKKSVPAPAPVATSAPAPSDSPADELVVKFDKIVNITRADGLQTGRSALESMISDTAAVIRQHGHELIRVTAIKYGKV